MKRDEILNEIDKILLYEKNKTKSMKMTGKYYDYIAKVNALEKARVLICVTEYYEATNK